MAGVILADTATVIPVRSQTGPDAGAEQPNEPIADQGAGKPREVAEESMEEHPAPDTK